MPGNAVTIDTDIRYEQWMRRAIELAEGGCGRVEPNPMVGCVLVRDGQIIGEGYHPRFGGPHAEVSALNDCERRGLSPAGCTAVVTLEPCCVQGKTPPCTEALIRAGVTRVVAAITDLDPRVAGGGYARLRQAGIEVVTGICEVEALELIAPYNKRHTTGLPWVIAKWAQTIDGKIATRTGDSRWISNEHSRRVAHELRARVDAVMVGVGTVIADDPSLTARDVEVRRVAKRVVIDPHRRTPKHAKLLNDGGPDVMFADEPKAALEMLSRAHHATNVLVEGGSKLLGSMFDQGLIDRALVFIAPKLAGDASAVGAVSGRSIDTITQAHAMTLHNMTQLGDDVLLDYRVKVK